VPPSRVPFLDWPGPIPFAHRGGASDEPENTLPAFQHAVDLGYRYLETDVQVTRDGVLVAFHDADLLRTTGRPGRIDELTWAEVRTARVSGREPIPLLDDLLGAFPEARVNIDCKTDRAVDALVAAIRRTASHGRVCIGAFGDRRLRTMRRRLGARVATSLSPVQVTSLRLAGWAAGGGECAQVPVKQGPVRVVDRNFVGRSHRAGLQVHVWTIDDAATMRRLLDLGVDGIMTDRPAVLKQVLQDRGQWFE
jgi:glycerophosphoryl diester phosphodiesterase